ncbi:COG4280 domain-containing protein [Herbaspirillum huttiense]|jgi:Ca2+/H+ antiporter, TMEM165/GDT1 family|uniref:COG4280 domain-containing protein n=1 Tax=Herbaspirillum huttiense TaxID=863372 RepID=UPI00381152EF
MQNLVHLAPTVLASFMASLVEFVEALTVVLAVGTVRGWRPAIVGTISALGILLLLVVFFGKSLAAIPLRIIQLVIGTLLLMFGLRWLRKAILRSAGVIPLHDETAAYQKEMALLRQDMPSKDAWDKGAFLTTFKIVMLEGIEVVFIVIAIGASGQLMLPASVGALAPLLAVILLGLWLHRPLANIPENTLKFGVGILLAAFGTFWVGEGIRIQWPGADLILIALIIGYFAIAHAVLWACKRKRASRILSAREKQKKAVVRSPAGVATIWIGLVAMFVDDGVLAGGTLAWIVSGSIVMAILVVPMVLAAILFSTGLALILATSAIRAASR